jgi:hypothetical protein
MAEPKPSNGARRVSQPQALKACPWCNGRLVLDVRYPVTRLIPGEVRCFRDDQVPERLRTVAAWVCDTPNCRFRAHAGAATAEVARADNR